MPDQGSIHLLPFDSSEYQRKSGGGGAREPLVDVTDELRGDLRTQIAGTVQFALSARERNDLPVPVRVRLRDRALAKSNRPYALLHSLALEVAAVEAPGELVVKGTVESLGGLDRVVERGATKDDLYSIATLESIDVWDALTESEAPGELTLQQQLSDGDDLLKLTFFPWLSLESRFQGDTSVLEFLEAAGLTVVDARVIGSQETVYLSGAQAADLDRIVELQGIRWIGVAPKYVAPVPITASYRRLGRVIDEIDASTADYPTTVGLLDSGVAAGPLAPWIVESIRNDPAAEVNEDHATFVAGLIIASQDLNDDTDLPDLRCQLIDVQIMPVSGLSEPQLLTRIESALDQFSSGGPKVWNCSFNYPDEMQQGVYSTFAQEMDELAERHNVLFVQSAGNYVATPLRKWPIDESLSFTDRLGNPAEAVRSLTVGSIAHLGGFVGAGSPSSFSRRGPGFSFIPKPDVSHAGGDMNSIRELDGHGIKSMLADGEHAEGIGTSFSAPLASITAATLWDRLTEGEAINRVRPELVKGLLIHDAGLRSQFEPAERNYFGWGTPGHPDELLVDTPDTFTTVHEVVLSPGNDWIKTPFPVPACLLVGGKLRADILLTICYSPPIRSQFGAESIRYDVDGGFGRVSTGARGRLNCESVVPQDSPASSHQWETQRLEGGKWSPIKSYRRRYPSGTLGANWGLRLSLTERVKDELAVEQLVYAILTFRAVDGDQNVYNDGVTALARLGVSNRTMLRQDRIRIDT